MVTFAIAYITIFEVSSEKELKYKCRWRYPNGGKNPQQMAKKKKNFWKWIFFALVDEIGSGRKRMWFNDCVVITFHSAVKPELMAYKKCGSVTTCSIKNTAD